MRYAIFADVHSNLEALEAVIQAYQSESIDNYLCVGDMVGYAANPKECVEKVKSLAGVTIVGNHDWASVNLLELSYFNPEAQEAIVWTRTKLDEIHTDFIQSLKLVYKNEDLTLVHSTLNNPRDFNYLTDGFAAEESFGFLGTNICFVGHTHVPGFFIKDKEELVVYKEDNSIDIHDGFKYIINVGSVGQPRNSDPKAQYCIYDTTKKLVEIKRIEYDIQKARDKIINAGLPQNLGDRLFFGQ